MQALTPYELMGGAAMVRRLVDHFYDVMERDPVAAGVRAMHPADLGGSREKLFMFLSGWLGGPSLYIEQFGHPRLRARHLPVSIGESERDQWMYCMLKALEAQPMTQDLRTHLELSFWNTADFMRNKAAAAGSEPPG